MEDRNLSLQFAIVEIVWLWKSISEAGDFPKMPVHYFWHSF